MRYLHTMSYGTKAMTLLLLAGILGTTACKHEPPEGPLTPPDDTGGPGPDEPCDVDVVYFQQDILPLLISNCAMPECHSNNSPADGIDLTSYQSLMSAGIVDPFDLNEDLFDAITDTDPDDRMPRPPAPPLTQAQIDLISDWIMQGAQNNSCASAGCDTLNVTYSGTIVPLVQQRCQGCHSGATPQGGLDLTSWSVLNTLANDGRLAGSVQHSQGAIPMPPSGPRLPDCNVRQFMIWIDGGAPNN